MLEAGHSAQSRVAKGQLRLNVIRKVMKEDGAVGLNTPRTAAPREPCGQTKGRNSVMLDLVKVVHDVGDDGRPCLASPLGAALEAGAHVQLVNVRGPPAHCADDRGVGALSEQRGRATDAVRSWSLQRPRKIAGALT